MKRFLALILVALLLCPVPVLAASGSSYTASLDSTPSNSGGTDVYVFIGSETASVYNAFQLTISYDPTMLELEGVDSGAKLANRELQYRETVSGTLTVAGCGADVACGSPAVILHFTPQRTGTTTVSLVKALVSASANVKVNAAPATLPDDNRETTITSGVYAVTLPTDLGLTGNATVSSGGNYTFRASAYYTYDLSATMNGSPVEITGNADGSFTIKNVTGALSITGTRTPKQYLVTVSGSGSGDVSAPSAATYGADFSFSVNKAAYTEYAVAVTVDGIPVTFTENSSGYTIPGNSITGDVAITVGKTSQNNTTLVLFVGSGASDVVCGSEYITSTGAAFDLLLNTVAGYDYEVSVNGRTISPNEYSVYTIPAELVNTSILTVTVTKTPQLSLSVQVSDFSATKGGGRVYMISVTPNATLPLGKVLSYQGDVLLWSAALNAYVCLTQTSTKPTAEAVHADLSLISSQTSAVTYNGDVNDTALVDVNDAQLAYDMYLGKYNLSEWSQTCWLRADVDGSGTLTVQDVQQLLQQLGT